MKNPHIPIGVSLKRVINMFKYCILLKKCGKLKIGIIVSSLTVTGLLYLQAYSHYRDSFVYNCRLDDHFLMTHSALLQSNGPIPYQWRSYIAIMVCKAPLSINLFTYQNQGLGNNSKLYLQGGIGPFHENFFAVSQIVEFI